MTVATEEDVRPVGHVVEDILLLPLKEGTSDLFGAWLVPGIAPEIRTLVGVRGGQVVAVASVNGADPVIDEAGRQRVIFHSSHGPIDLRALADLLEKDSQGLRMWGGPRRPVIAD